jgi:hypothetical protein
MHLLPRIRLRLWNDQRCGGEIDFIPLDHRGFSLPKSRQRLEGDQAGRHAVEGVDDLLDLSDGRHPDLFRELR